MILWKCVWFANTCSSFVSVPVCLEKPSLDLLDILERLEINDLAWIKVLVEPLS